MATPANLDAFLPREDFNAEGNNSSAYDFHEMGLIELREQWVHVLRKPDFQRTTDDWDPDQISEFIKSFAEGDVIPGLIFWASPKTGNILVIDGAHRISAMLAWIFDDYGDMERSSRFLGYQPNTDQTLAAEATRRAVQDKIGAYQDIANAPSRPNSSARLKRLASSMTAMRFKIQWVRGDARKAEDSFYRINLRSVALNKTEIKLIRERDKPSAIATRAIVQNGEGHQYWQSFPQSYREQTVVLAKEIHRLLFSPPLKDDIRSAHVPIAGKAYAGTAMEIALELVEFAGKPLSRGSVAKKTVEALEKTRGALAKINGKYDGCLGLHPAVYFYSHASGKHQPAALIAVIKWVGSFDKNRFKQFTSVRRFFEEFLIANAKAIGNTISTRGSRGRSVPTLINYYNFVLDQLLKGNKGQLILDEMRKESALFPFAENLPDLTTYGVEFSSQTKSASFLIDALNGAPECRICKARYHPDSVNSDHNKDKSQGGMGTPSNHDPTHFYCNGAKPTLRPIIQAAWQSLGETI